MKIENEYLKNLYQRYITSKVPNNRNKCPSPLALFNSFKSSTSLRKKKKIIDHITNCSFCKDEFDLLLALQRHLAPSITILSKTPLTASPNDKPGPVNNARRFTWRYAYILLFLVLILSAYYLSVQQNTLIEVKRASEQNILLIAPAHVHTFPKALIFRWKEQSSSQYYILELFDNSLLPIWTSQKIFDVQIQLPDRVLPRLQSGNYYFWMITAFSSTQKISESELIRFLVLIK